MSDQQKEIDRLTEENARLREALEMAETYVSSYEFNNEDEYNFVMNQIREALKGGQ
jgi:dynactin complex subunit